jgi:hypothetical protein
MSALRYFLISPRMKHLLYTTIGFSREYCQLLKLFLQSLCKVYKTKYTICILCDTKFVTDVKAITEIYPCFSYIFLYQPNAKTGYEASMNKLHIFDVPNIDEFTNILYVDLDCLFFVEPDIFLEQSLEKGVLYCAQDPAAQRNPHTDIMWSLKNYSDDELEMFKQNKVVPFNAGFFLFQNSDEMKQHFRNILQMISEWKTDFFYEQSFMNVYFNRLFQTSRNVTFITPKNYMMFPRSNVEYKNCIIHFCGSAGNGNLKYEVMQNYWNTFGKEIKCQYFQTRKQMLHYFIKPGTIMLEIGVFEGEFANEILEANPQSLFLVDCWDFASPTCVSGNVDGNYVKSIQAKDAYEKVKEKYKDDKRVYVIRDFSQNVHKCFQESSLHLVYIDGDHSYKGVKRDLELYYPKVVNGGWICGHDYEINRNKAHHIYDFGVKQAVDEFCAEKNLRISYKALDGCVSFAIQKK